MATTDTDLGALGREIRRYRKAKQLSQEGLAELAGVTRNYIGFLERGERNPPVKTVVKVARALGVRPALLLAELS